MDLQGVLTCGPPGYSHVLFACFIFFWHKVELLWAICSEENKLIRVLLAGRRDANVKSFSP